MFRLFPVRHFLSVKLNLTFGSKWRAQEIHRAFLASEINGIFTLVPLKKCHKKLRSEKKTLLFKQAHTHRYCLSPFLLTNSLLGSNVSLYYSRVFSGCCCRAFSVFCFFFSHFIFIVLRVCIHIGRNERSETQAGTKKKR